jgi:hypothetical protein
MKVFLISLLFLVPLMETDAQSVREQVVHAYTAEIGVREATGHNDGEPVEKYLASTGLGKGYAWCAAFVNWVYQQNGIEGPKTPAWSPSWFPNSKKYDSQKQIPQPGDLFGIYFRSKGRIAHVGFIDKWQGTTVLTVEGNTNEAGSREGDGVYRKRRLARQIYKTANWIDDDKN